MIEIWLPVVGYEGLYEVSNLGRVRSLNYNHTKQVRILNQHKTRKGYFLVDLWKNKKRKGYGVHRLVAEAFIPNWFEDQQVNHIDEDKTNNNVDNLEWCDCKYNNNHGSRNYRISKSNTNGKLSKVVLQLTKTGELVREWPSSQEAGRNGFRSSHIRSCCCGLRQYHKGYIWRYKSESA